MGTTSISVTEFVRGFSEYVNRVVYRQERFILRKGRKPVAELRPVASGVRLSELAEVLQSLPRLSHEEAEAFGADLDAARKELPPARSDDPWAS